MACLLVIFSYCINNNQNKYQSTTLNLVVKIFCIEYFFTIKKKNSLTNTKQYKYSSNVSEAIHNYFSVKTIPPLLSVRFWQSSTIALDLSRLMFIRS